MTSSSGSPWSNRVEMQMPPPTNFPPLAHSPFVICGTANCNISRIAIYTQI
jgi:hypothetical protein